MGFLGPFTNVSAGYLEDRVSFGVRFPELPAPGDVEEPTIDAPPELPQAREAPIPRLVGDGEGADDPGSEASRC